MPYIEDAKVRDFHLEKNAYLYVRQSTLRQVAENTESTRRQYGLKKRAVSMGWQEEQIQVIDMDLGKSGSSTIRDGFRFLVSEVSMGRAGVVMGLEVSRLARNSIDWHRLLEICALTQTLILDEEGIYDPSHFNDRMLLGLKGTMSEAELFMIRQRLIGEMISKARRGELKIRLPIGYEYDRQDRVVLSPDKRVRETVELFFKTYRRLGSGTAVAQKFNKEGIKFPKRMFSGPRKKEIVFGKLTAKRAYQVLRNPRYAGAYAYGLRQQVPRGLDKKPLVKFVKKDKWKVLLKDAHQGYITWEEYEDNLSRLKENARCTEDTRRCPPGQGPALLQGIAVCGICGRRMGVRYRKSAGDGLSPYYGCRGSHDMYYCQSISGKRIDSLVEKLLLEKMSPSVLEVALGVQEELAVRIEEADSLRFRHVEKARYEMEHAKRRYMAVDPLNRLVADELEAEWNESIAEYKRQQKDYEKKQKQDRFVISKDQKKRVLELASDFPALWNSDTTGSKDRKRMVRLLILDVTLVREESIKVKIRFRGGATEVHELPVAKNVWEERKHSPEVIKEIDRLLDDHTDGGATGILNDKGYLSGTGKSFTARRVSKIRRAYGITSRYARLRKKGLLTIGEICKKQDVKRWVVYEWRKSGNLKAYRYDDAGRYLYEEDFNSIITQ
jgi:DNA invertase Pin-like site-specific DNA recombinase